MKCTICKRITRDNKSNICSKCRGLTLRELIKKDLINPKIFQKQSPQIKKDKDDGSNVSLSGDTKKLQRETNKDEHMSVSLDNQSAENYKRRFVEDDTLLNWTKETEGASDGS